MGHQPCSYFACKNASVEHQNLPVVHWNVGKLLSDLGQMSQYLPSAFISNRNYLHSEITRNLGKLRLTENTEITDAVLMIIFRKAMR